MATAVTVSATATGSKSISSPVKITATVDASSTPPELAETIFKPGLPEAILLLFCHPYLSWWRD